MITKTSKTRRVSIGNRGTASRSVMANQSITSGVRNRSGQKANPASGRSQAILASLSPEKRRFAKTLQNTHRQIAKSITAATNTSNIMARPDFVELLPLFVQKLLVLDAYGSVAMKSRSQVIPYFKFVAENTKGETAAGTVLSSPFVNRQGVDPNFTGRVIKGEGIAIGDTSYMGVAYTPVLPGTVTIQTIIGGVTTPYTDNGMGELVSAANAVVGTINYSDGTVVLDSTALSGFGANDMVKATYQYDNETVGPDAAGNYGAKMGKGYLDLDEFTLKAEAHEIACYWSIFSAFAAQQEYGANIGELAKEAAFGELTAEMNTLAFAKLRQAAAKNPVFNWDASAILSGSVVPKDYLNMFKLKLNQAADNIYQRTRLARGNTIVAGTNAGGYFRMLEGFNGESVADAVGPYKLGTLDGDFNIFVDPNYNPDTWVLSCKSDDIRRNSALFGEYMPFADTQALGLANASVQQGYANMYAMEVVNPDTVVSGKIIGLF